jgi:hypothetical protein
MATETLASADAILKDLYPAPIREQTNYKTWLLDRIERDSTRVDFEGRRAIMPLHTTQNPSEGSIADGGTLPTPGVEGNADAIVPIRYVASGLELTDMLIKQAKTNRGAFVSALTDRTKRLADGFRKKVNRQLFGDGIGTLATLATSPAGATTFTVDSTQYLKVGQIIDVRTKSDGTLENAGNVSLTISAINRTTKVVTVSANVTATTTTAGVYIAGSYGLELEGLRRIGATGRTLYGINSSTAGNEYWDPQVKAAAGATAGEDLFIQLGDLAAGASGADAVGELDVWLTTRGIRRRLAGTYTSQKRYNDARAMEIHGGYSAIYVNETPVIADDDVPKGYAFGLRNDAFTLFEVERPDFLADPESGKVWNLANGSVAGTRKAVWQAWWVWYANLGAAAPNQVAVISGAADETA